MEAAKLARQAVAEIGVGLPLVTAPWWLEYFDSVTHFILAGGGSTFVLLGVALRVREWFHGRKRT